MTRVQFKHHPHHHPD
ncbi:his operon leader peptide [Escherichia coli]|nr:his operon leader peptide [Escherichia coli]EFH7848305.1 his operon leader peptide [Escherichia coli]MDS0697189.1 his operon leader peptide [Escherichia coli]MDS0707783.1 his operon leader peptide [Escherichia coli]MWR62202.1 his operon leader peptide [Escherichia coli]HCT5469747.1 his operon leader peptide [Escherichia coli]